MNESEIGTRLPPLLAAAVLILSPGAAPQSAPMAQRARLHVTSAVDGDAVPEAFVLLSPDTPQQATSVSNATGHAVFPDIEIPPSVQGDEMRSWYIARVFRTGFLPLQRAVWFSEREACGMLRLVPEGAGFLTPWIHATRGGRFHLEGLGLLVVAPGALAHDVALRLTPIPMVSWSYGLPESDPGAILYQVHVAAQDAQGSPAPGALPQVPNGITLTVQLPVVQQVPGAMGVTWLNHARGDTFGHDHVGAAFVADSGVATISLGAGHNILMETYHVPGAAGCGPWGPWELDWKYVQSRRTPHAIAGFNCGRFTSGASARVHKGEQRTSTMEISATAVQEVGYQAGVDIAKLTGKTGFSLTGITSQSVCTTTASESEARVGHGEGVNGSASGAPAGTQGDYDCTTGKVILGSIYRKYDIWARRRRVCPDGSIEREAKKLGSVEVFFGVGKWYEGPMPNDPGPVWNGNCAGCAATGQVPPFAPDS